MCILCVTIVIGIALFTHVGFLMWKMHQYEFRRRLLCSILFFLIMTFFYVL